MRMIVYVDKLAVFVLKEDGKVKVEKDEKTKDK